MFGRIWTMLLAVTIAAFASDAIADGRMVVSHHESLQQFRLSDTDSDRIGPVGLRFDALGRSFDLELQPNARLLRAMAENGIDGDIRPFRGILEGNADSWASIVLVDGMPSGLIFDGEEIYAVEAPGDAVVDTATPIIYRLKDAIITPGSMSCGLGEASTSGAAFIEATTSGFETALARAPGAVSQIDIGAVGDFEFSHVRSNPEAAIITRLNNVDVYFSEQIEVQINVTVIDTYSTVDDPFPDTTVPGELLVAVAEYRNTTPAQRSQGLTHLYTGRNLNGSTVGIAYTGNGALCHPYYGSGLSEGNDSAAFDSLIAAHEIGHNFGAVHDGADVPCQDVVGSYIMSATLDGSATEFSQCSIDMMQAEAATASCVTPMPNTDIGVGYTGAPPTVLLSNAATVTFDVANTGTEAATGITADITLPANVELVAASSASGDCTNGAGEVNCELDDLPGGSATTVTLSATTIATGVALFEAEVAATVDENATNNTAAVAVTVQPAVDLVATAPAAIDLQEDRSTTVTVDLDNAATLDASGITLVVALTPGLQATSATWPIGSCTVTGARVDCTATSFDRQSSTTLRLGVTAVSRGSQSYTATLASTEADANPANNAAVGSIRVTAAAASNGGDDDGGSGSFGLAFLALLGIAVALRTRRLTQ